MPPGAPSTTAPGGRVRPSVSGAASCCGAADIMRRELDRLAELESLDCGKPIGEARDDLEEVVFMCEYYGGWATKIYGDIPPVGPDAM